MAAHEWELMQSYQSLFANHEIRVEQAFFELTKIKGAVTETAIEKVFDQLPPVSPETLLGQWDGHSFETDHPTHQRLSSLKWAGKDFRSIYDVDPMMVYNEEGNRVWDPQFGHAQVWR